MRRDVDEKELRDGWEKLTQSWEEFDELREVLLHNDPNVFLQRPDMERFISGWQVCVSLGFGRGILIMWSDRAFSRLTCASVFILVCVPPSDLPI